MAADAGLVELHEPIVAVAGTGHGADTALVIRPAPTAEFLDSKVDRIICLPRHSCRKEKKKAAGAGAPPLF